MERKLARGHVREGSLLCVSGGEKMICGNTGKGCSGGSGMEWWDGEVGSYFGLIARGWRIAARGGT